MSSIGAYYEMLQRVREFTRPEHPKFHRGNVKNVIVILTSSRSGSTYFKALLAQHPHVASLIGEEEPYYILTGNRFMAASDSDALSGPLHNIEEVANYIATDLQVNEKQESEFDYAVRWCRRLPLQILRIVPLEEISLHLEKKTFRQLLGNAADLYDGLGTRTPFTFEYKIEEPPFVWMSRRPALQFIGGCTLLFKTPQNAYRAGLFEQLYPNADIKYIHLTRGVAQTVNGLMDGWECNYGFYAHNMKLTGVELNIAGYDNRHWWKFDLPPNWRGYTNAPLPEVCLNQWMSAHWAILQSNVKCHRVHFEDLMDCTRRSAVISDVLKFCGLQDVPLPSLMDKMMATEDPTPFRWRKRQDLLKDLVERPPVRMLMGELGYKLDESTWT